MLYHKPQAGVQVNGVRSEAFVLERSVRQGCLQSPLLYVLALEPLLRRLSDETANPALRGVFLLALSADNITVFVSRRSDSGGDEGG